MGKPLFKSAKQIAVDAQALKLAMQRGDMVSNDKSTVRYEDDDSAYINTVLPDVVVTPKYKDYDDYNKTIAARDRRTLEQQQHEMNSHVRDGMNKAGEVVAGAMMMLPPVAAADPIAFGVGRALRFAIPRLRAAIMASRAATNSTTGATNISRMLEWTPEQWTAAQDAAIARGDISEAQRLRDLHFEVSAPNTQIKDIQYHGAKGNAIFNVFDPKLIGQTDQGWAGRGYYFTPSKDYAKMYGSEPRAFYINAQKVHDGTASTYFGREDGPAAQAFKIIRKKHGNDGQQILDDLASSDAIKTSFPQTRPYNGEFEEVVTRNNNQMKLADAVTYDDNGVRIPLGERDNFNMNDIRYALPFVLPSSKLSVEDEVDDTQLNN